MANFKRSGLPVIQYHPVIKIDETGEHYGNEYGEVVEAKEENLPSKVMYDPSILRRPKKPATLSPLVQNEDRRASITMPDDLLLFPASSRMSHRRESAISQLSVLSTTPNRRESVFQPLDITDRRVSFMGPEPTQFPTTVNDITRQLMRRRKVKNPRQFMARRKVSTTAWVCFGLIVLSFVVTLIIFLAPGWGHTLEIKGWNQVAEGIMYGDYGLWFACYHLHDDFQHHLPHVCELIGDLPAVPMWYKACQAMAIIILLASIGAVSTISVYAFSMRFNKNRNMIAASCSFCLLAGLTGTILFIVFCVKFIQEAYWCKTCMSGSMQVLEYKLHYAFIMGCAVSGFWYMGVLFCLIEWCSLRIKKKKLPYMQYVISTRPPGQYPPGRGRLYSQNSDFIGGRGRTFSQDSNYSFVQLPQVLPTAYHVW